jgi:hypothetical protein
MFAKVVSLFGSKASSQPKPGPQIAMPLFATANPISPDAIVAQWTALFPRRPPLRIAKHEAAESPMEYEVEGRRLMAIHLPMPVPNDEAVHAVATSWMWQQADTPVRGHVAHAIVTAIPDAEVVATAWDVARLSAAMLKAGAGAALYWGNGRQVHAPHVVEQLAQSEETPPVPLWVGITISAEIRTGPFSAATHGLAALGHREFEVRGSRMPIGNLRTTLLDLALYVLQEGAVLKHGQTFGPSAEEKWRIRHEASKLVPGREAIVLAIP